MKLLQNPDVEPDIMKVLGHSRMETTLRYLHEDEGRMKKAVEIIEERFLKEKS